VAEIAYARRGGTAFPKNSARLVKRLRQEAGELLAILAASRRTAIRNLLKAQEMDAV
jgi:hypothetical protein